MGLLRNSSLEQIQSILSGYQRLSSHKLAVSGSWILLLTPFRNQQWQFNPEETARLCQRNWQEAARTHQKFFGVFLSMKYKPVKTNKTLQVLAICPLTDVLCLYAF